MYLCVPGTCNGASSYTGKCHPKLARLGKKAHRKFSSHLSSKLQCCCCNPMRCVRCHFNTPDYSLEFLLQVPTWEKLTFRGSMTCWVNSSAGAPLVPWASLTAVWKQMCGERAVDLNCRRDIPTKILLHLSVINKPEGDSAITTLALLVLGAPSPLLVSAWLSSSLRCIKISVCGELSLQGTAKAGC